MDLKEHWIREKVANGSIVLKYVRTAKMVADGLTKGLPKPTFEFFRAALGIVIDAIPWPSF